MPRARPASLEQVLAGPQGDFDAPLERCPVCLSDRIRFFMRDGRGISLWRCAHCCAGFMNPRYSDRALAEYYAGYSTEQVMETQVEERRQARKRFALARLRRFVNQGRYLSIGAWDGLEMKLAAEAGFEVEGFDVDPVATARTSALLGRPVHCGDFLDDSWLPRDLFPEGRPGGGHGYQALMMDQVLEHPKETGRYLLRAVSLLAPGGVIYLGVPNLGSLSNRLKTLRDRIGWSSQRRRGKHFDTWHHLTFFSPRSLAFAVVEVAKLELLVMAGEPDPKDSALRVRAKELCPALDSTLYALARRR